MMLIAISHYEIVLHHREKISPLLGTKMYLGTLQIFLHLSKDDFLSIACMDRIHSGDNRPQCDIEYRCCIWTPNVITIYAPRGIH